MQDGLWLLRPCLGSFPVWHAKVPGIWGILGPAEAAPHRSGAVLGAGVRFPAAGTWGGQEG